MTLGSIFPMRQWHCHVVYYLNFSSEKLYIFVYYLNGLFASFIFMREGQVDLYLSKRGKD